MIVLKILTFPLWFPFWLIWTILAFIGRAIWFVFTLSVKTALVLILILLLIAWLWS